MARGYVPGLGVARDCCPAAPGLGTGYRSPGGDVRTQAAQSQKPLGYAPVAWATFGEALAGMALPRRSAGLGRYAGPQLQSGIAHGNAGVLEHQTPVVIDETALEIEAPRPGSRSSSRRFGRYDPQRRSR